MPETAADDGQLADELVDLPVVSSEVVFDGAIWDVRRDRFLYGTDYERWLSLVLSGGTERQALNGFEPEPVAVTDTLADLILA